MRSVASIGSVSSQVASAGAKHGDRALGAADGDLQIEMGMDSSDFRQQRRKHVQAHRHSTDEPECSAKVFLLVGDGRDGLLQILKNAVAQLHE